MSRRIALFCALIGLVAFVVGPAYAEVQNIKISGDITAMGLYRSNYDLEDEAWANPQGVGLSPDNKTAEDDDSLLVSVVRLRVDADLTDNVAATVRLANLREWDANADTTGDADIVLDLANITLKEMLYSPLTMIIGRQELLFGNGLIVGYGLYQDPNDSIKYDDLSSLHGYDAVRAILDYDPLTINLVAAKIQENDDTARASTSQDEDSDTDLYGVNLGYTFNKYDAEMEGYFFAKRDENYNLTFPVNSPAASNDRVYEENRVYTLGLRGSLVPMENLTLNGEVATQMGKIYDQQAGGSGSYSERDREALAVNVAAEYDLVNTKFAPTLGLEYLYLSGEEAASDGDFEAWDPMYRGKLTSVIRDCLENIYTTNDPADTNGWSNQHTIKAKCELDLGELIDGLSFDLSYMHFWFDEEPVAGADDDIGNEVDLKLTYDYTEDVEFALNGAYFIAGDYYDQFHGNLPMELGGMSTNNTLTNRIANDDAISIIGSCKVTF